ncbi:helix-turn-helix domain-containing protein [Spongiivirga citrea]|uniref:Helix-turn-helix domain-containing protein n=1 Tax=Spongiivirga citrea TaxID=1481457 RepID=A0A6M0CFW7_9FLAO|nr:helix-turn-helix domain-containing protein [Spongiivirga citrea]NER16725.1 helix-turn-helix domain-containing protein [Spongiivirga citrea]
MMLIIDFILVAGIVISVIILFLLFKTIEKRTPKKLLVVYFSFILAVILHSYASLHNIETLYKATFIFDFTIIWLFGPLLFVYIKSIFHAEDKLILKNGYHFTPFFVISLFIGVPLLITLYRSDWTFEYLELLERNQIYIVVVRNLYFICYILFSLQLLQRLKKTIKHNFSSISAADVNWVQFLLIGCFIFISVDLLTRVFEGFFESNVPQYQYLTIFLIIILTAYLGFNGVSNSRILVPDFLIEMKSKPNSELIVSNSLSNYSDEEISVLKEKLTDVIVNNKLFLNPELTLGMLANEIDLSDKKLSALLNKYLNTSFYDYINSYRIEEVKKRLHNRENEKFTLLSIAFDCGFNSKASFNRIFKNQIGISPSQFIKNQSTP